MCNKQALLDLSLILPYKEMNFLFGIITNILCHVKYIYNFVATRQSDKYITPQPLYNTIVGVQVNFRVSYPIRVITRVKCIVI